MFLCLSPLLFPHETIAVLLNPESNQMARGASQPRPAQEHTPLGPATMETVGKATGDSGIQGSPGSGSKRKLKKKSSIAGIYNLKLLIC